MYYDEEIKQIFAERLKYLREKKGLSQEELGDKLGVSRGSISFYEKKKRVPDIIFLKRASDFFQVNPNYLIGESENEDINFEGIGLLLDISDEAAEKVMELECGDILSEIFEHEYFERLCKCSEYFFLPEKFGQSRALMQDPDLSYEFRAFQVSQIIFAILTSIKEDISQYFYSQRNASYSDGDKRKLSRLKAEAEYRNNIAREILEEAENVEGN